ncbi:stabilin-2 [Elysia marginata]|uniref:Stabilin-2 n=1 Tax=Elysia marginata TaxID=1093978 RepID=A0AAV4FVY6_9GAST|nr:stabilin-2 [Elysia marginata]
MAAVYVCLGHVQAECSPLRPGLASGERRTCACPVDMSGNGTVCHGTIAEQVMAHPNLTRLAAYMATIPAENLLLLQDDEEYTFFAPSDAAMDEFITSIGERQDGRGWGTQFDVFMFLNFHTLYKMYSLEDMELYNGILRSYPTLYDGFSVFTVNTKKQQEVRDCSP